MARRLRLLHFIVQPVMVWDDGEAMESAGNVQPKPFTLAQLQEHLDQWPEVLEGLAKQLTPESVMRPESSRVTVPGGLEQAPPAAPTAPDSTPAETLS